MDLLPLMPGFVLAVLLISASPGPATALVLRRAAVGGFRGALPTVLGLELGLYVWALSAGAGLSGVVAASELAYAVMRALGAALLIYLGVSAWRSALRRTAAVAPAPLAQSATPPRPGRAFAEGALVMLTNPKAAAFMFAFYPQFVPEGRPLLATTAALALVQVVVEIAFYLLLAATVSRASGWFSRPPVRRRLDAVTGTVLVILGLRLAASPR